MFGFGYGEVGRKFKETYRCFSVTMCDRQDDPDRGGKIIMPGSALDQLTRLHIQWPMLFKLNNKSKSRETHCGVLEFVAEEGRIYIPHWMMRNLLLDEGDMIEVENVSLKVATFARFQPQSVDFLDITNPKAVLENMLRNFACLTADDIISIKYNEREYELLVLETKPDRAVSIIECDMNVDFAPPVGYQEPTRPVKKQEHESEEMPMDFTDDTDPEFTAFSGTGNRLDGKKKGLETPSSNGPTGPPKRGIPNYNYKKGTLTFIRTQRPIEENGEDKADTSFEAFSGQGQALRKKKK